MEMKLIFGQSYTKFEKTNKDVSTLSTEKIEGTTGSPNLGKL